MGHPSFVMSASFTNQTLAQIELWTNPKAYERKVYTLPKQLDEKVARLHLAKVGAKLTELTPEQADYIGVPPTAPTSPTTTGTESPFARHTGESRYPAREATRGEAQKQKLDPGFRRGDALLSRKERTRRFEP